ncbi:MAG TPA: tetratricopeptide repeat protein, partial [Methylovirgula sp.]|nr:tetratricopeptide repeat protein [Methylovirgula sp.]
ELLSALEASKSKGLPDVYVFRKTADAALPTADLERRLQAQTQLDALEAFWSEWFKSEKGHFRAAFQTFPTTDDFEAQIEELLRQWLQSHHLLGPRLKWPKEKGSPFPGLAPFEAGYAAVFFGRDRAIDDARRRLAASAESGTPFLLIVGASGSGKSSLARAGLIPRLTTPGVVETIHVWRVARMKPSEGQSGPVSSVAAALLAALPELAQGDFPDAAALSDNLRRGGAAAARPIARALMRIAEAERQERHSDQPLRAALVLLIDQLEELFAQTVHDEERAAFAQAIKELAATGIVWCIATLRADLYELLLKQPMLRELKESGATLDLSPPGPAELAEIVHAPAAAAGLAFEHSAEKGALDERLLADAKTADSLPLLQFALRHLYEQRVETDAGTQLTHAAYDALGGLQGAIAAEAERAVANLPTGTLDALPRLLRRLAEPARDGTSFTLRAAEHADIASDPAEMALADALLAARIAIAGTDAGGRPTLRLAHDAVLTAWPRAAEAAQASRDFYRVRAEVEDALRRWQGHGQPKDRLIQRGVPLAEAEQLVSKFADELPAELVGFVNASQRQARLRQRLVAGAAVFFLVIAVLAGWQWRAAVSARAEVERQRDRAEHDLNLATDASNGLVRDLADKLRFASGVPTPVIKEIIGKARELQEQLFSAGESSPQLRWSQSAALIEYSRAQFLLGDLNAALEAARKSNDIAKGLMSTSLPDTEWARVLMGSYETMGLVLDEQGRTEEALAVYNAQLVLAKTMTSKYTDDVWRSWRASADRGVASMLIKLHRIDEALAAYREALEIRKTLAQNAPGDSERQRDVATATADIGDVFRAEGHLAEALAQYREDMRTLEMLAGKDPTNTLLQDDLIIDNNKLGSVFKAQGQPDQALAAYERARAIAEKLVLQNEGNARWQGDLAYSTEQVADLLLDRGRIDQAISAYRDLVAVRSSLASSNPENSQLAVYLSGADEELGFALEKKRDLAGSLEAYQDSLAVEQKLTKSAPGNTDWQDSLSGTYERIGDVQHAQGHLAESLASYQAALAIRQRLTNSDPGNADFERDAGKLYVTIGDVQKEEGKLPDALASYDAGLVAMERLAKSNPGISLKKGLAGLHEIIGDVQNAMGKPADAVASYQVALTIVEQLVRADSSDTDLRYQVLAAHQEIGDLQKAQNKLTDALISYRNELAVAKDLASSDPGNARWQRCLAEAYELIGDIQERLNRLEDAVSSYGSSLAIRKALLAKEPSNTEWQRDLSVVYNNLGDLLGEQNKLNDALAAYRSALAILQALNARDKTNANWRDGLSYSIGGIGGLAFHFLLVHDFADALVTADQAISLAPDKTWLYTNRAHALMFLGRTDEARSLYLQYRNQKNVQEGKSWAAVILDDFAELRKAGLSNPLMDEIEKDFKAAG